MKSPCGRLEALCLWMLALSVVSLVGLSALFFCLNFEGSNTFQPYISDRFQLPFPSLFREFELDSPFAIKSGVRITRGQPETCYRRLAPEYETFLSTSPTHAEYVSGKKFIVGGDMPPGWMSYTAVDVMAVYILDGCRLDYTIIDPDIKPDDLRNVFVNHLKVFHDYMDNQEAGSNSRIFRFVAPIPTFTVYSLKTTFTGESRRGNMIGQANNIMEIEIDNVGKQTLNNNERLCVVGDASCSHLFGKENIFINHSGESSDIFDMEKPDNLSFAHYKEAMDQCDVTMVHLVAIDHLGHNGRRLTSTMTHYLDKYDAYLKEAFGYFSKHKNRMLMAFGDHGQKTNGSHGGSSREEIDSFLFVNSDLEFMNIPQSQCELDDEPTGYTKYHSVLSGNTSLKYPLYKSAHLHWSATFSVLKNQPIPFHGEGSIIKEIIPVVKDDKGNIDEALSLKYLTQILHITAHKTIRTLDTTLSEKDKARYHKLYFDIKRQRQIMANFYNYIRSMGPNQLNLEEMKELYGAYMKECDRFLALTKRLLGYTSMLMTPEYMVTSILVMTAALLSVFYFFLPALRLYYVNNITEDEAALFEGQKFPSILRITFRLFWKLALSLLLTYAFSKHMEYIDSKNHHRKLLGRAVIESIFKRIIIHFEHFLGIFEEIAWFHSVCWASLIFGFLFLLDTPFLVRGYYLISKELANVRPCIEPPLPTAEYEPAIKGLISGMFTYDPVWGIALIYVIVSFMTITSQCAIISHDLLIRHILLISLYLALAPFVKQVGTLKLYGIYRNFGFLVFVIKTTYLVHPYIERRDIGKMVDQWYINVQNFMRKFEVNALVLTGFFYIQLVFTRKTKKQPESNEVTTPLMALQTSKVNTLFLRASFTFIYISLMAHYLFKSEALYFFDEYVTAACISLTGLENVQDAKNVLAYMSARCCGAFVVLVWVALTINPFGVICPPKGSPYRRSSSLFWSIVNITWASLLLNGPKKAFCICVLGFVLYNLASLLLKTRIRGILTCIILFFYVGDMMYFAIGHRDSLFELDFDAAFVFVDTYRGLLSDIAVFLAFSTSNVSTTAALYYLFLLEGEKRYVSLQSQREANSLENGPPESFTFSAKRLDANVSSRMLRDVVGYMCVAIVHMQIVIALLYPLANNQCAVTDFYPKGLFTIGKMIVNTACFLCIYIFT